MKATEDTRTLLRLFPGFLPVANRPRRILVVEARSQLVALGAVLFRAENEVLWFPVREEVRPKLKDGRGPIVQRNEPAGSVFRLALANV
jgi:hypothetical protein